MLHVISQHTGISESQVAAVIALINDKATIPFIARYRKERTGNLDEIQIASICDNYHKMQELVARRDTIIKSITEQGKMTDDLANRLHDCWDATLLEDIYLPYKPHRKTRADIAIEKGFEPLANLLMRQDRHLTFPRDEQGLQYARDIIAQRIAEDERARNAVRREFAYSAILTTKRKTAAKDLSARDLAIFEQTADNYRDYFAISEPLRRISAHRLLAIRRAETEGYIRVDISPDAEKCLDKLAHIFLRNDSEAAYQVELAMEDAYRRMLKASIENEYAALSKEKADTEAIRIFADNLRQLLLASPLGQQRVLSLDPGFRTGCKTVVLSAQGDLLTHTVIYLHQPEAACRTLANLCTDYQIQAIAIGNGTASRETEALARQAIQSLPTPPAVYVVSEAGASVYSASKIARDEFPDQDVTVRGAVSIGRRLMDPLAELVKIEPKAIGVGQYQHDVDQVRLRDSLAQTVESVVNHVGVDVNTASRHLLTYISGLGPTLAQNIVDYRTANGAFTCRKDLLKVPKMGAKTFEQAAGFLRVTGSRQPLDNSAVHPEAYPIVELMARDLGCTITDLMQDDSLRKKIDIQRYVTLHDNGEGIGLSTLQDIMHELEKPTRDPRTQLVQFHFDDSVHTIDDLREGMVLPGIVTNISAFGAFVDLGVHKDGLIHISEMANRRISSPAEVVKIQEHVRVRVINIDRARARIQLSLKQVGETESAK